MVRLYQAYLDELENYTDEPFTQKAEEILVNYRKRCYEKRLIFDEGKFAGFLIIATPPDCHPDCDYFICQAYLRPESRGKGLMKDAFDKFVNGNPGVYCLDVLFKNRRAREYWFKRFKELGYIDISLPFIEHGVTGICETLFFERRQYADSRRFQN